MFHGYICPQGEIRPGVATLMCPRRRKVPANICDSCGERYYDSDTAKELLARAGGPAIERREVFVGNDKDLAGGWSNWGRELLR